MKNYTDGVVKRALAHMGYSTMQANMFMARAYPSDKAALIADAVVVGFDVDAAMRLESVPTDFTSIEQKEQNDDKES